MKSVLALSAATALCTLWLAGCASTPDKPVPNAPLAAKPGDTADGLGPTADTNAIANNLPTSLDGEIRRAQELRSKGDLDDAAEALAQIMIVAPDDARVVGEYGKVLAQKGDAQGAQAFLKRAVALRPKDWTLYSALGVACDQLDDHASARSAYEHALALQPGEPSVLNNYAVSRMLAGDLVGARRLLDQAASHDANNTKIENNLAKLASMEPDAPRAVAPTAVPAHATVQTSPPPALRTANAAPRLINQPVTTRVVPPATVMQAVPVDPLAGPVAASAPHKVASAAKPKHVAQKASNPAPSDAPALRTAADAN